MSFNHIVFPFLFLPISLILYYLTPKRFRNAPLILVSLVFYAWGSPVYLLLMLLSIILNYMTGLEIEEFLKQGRHTGAKISMLTAVAVNLLILCFFKYIDPLISAINSVLSLSLKAPDLPMPLGLSFFTFSVLSYVLDVYHSKTPAQKNILDFILYAAFFGKVTSGPIVLYRDMAPQLRDRNVTFAGFGSGINLFLVGLMKKVLIADSLGKTFSAISGLSAMSVFTAWLGMILYSLQLYFDFSGYSDMAIGLAKLFGFQFEKNFNYPYLSASISEFWRRWHISLGRWFREYVYIPLGGNRCSVKLQIRNLAVVWILTGLWHGSSLNFLLWGVYHGAIILLEKFVLKDILEKIPKPVRILGTVFLVFFGWVLFFSPSLSSAVHYYGQMFGAGRMGMIDSTFRYYFADSIRILIVAVIGCCPIAKALHQRLTYRRGGVMTYLSVILYVLLLMVCVAYMVSATYSSFLYSQF